jgi:pantoate kinase
LDVGERYVWQSYNYLLVSGSAAAYRPLVANALTYVANFSGVGTYAVFDFSLGVIFGVSVSGSSFTALCGGSSTPLGSLPTARWVELRPLSGFGDVIIRDRYGAVLARYGCRHTAAPQYVGFRDGLLRVYSVEAWG